MTPPSPEPRPPPPRTGRWRTAVLDPVNLPYLILGLLCVVSLLSRIYLALR